MRISGVTYVSRRTHKLRFVFIALIVILFILLLAASAISAFAGWKVMHPKRFAAPAFSSNIVPEFEDVYFKDINGKVALRGWYFQAKNNSSTIILSHDYATNRLQNNVQTLDLIKTFISNGYNVFTFDYRGCGISSKSTSSFGINEKDDLAGAISYVRSTSGSEKIMVLGFSAGASTALLCAGDKDYGKYIKAIAADNPYSTLESYLDEKLPQLTGLPSFPFNKTIMLSMKLFWGLNVYDGDILDSLEQATPTPVLFIDRKSDENAAYKSSDDLYLAYLKIAGDKACLWKTDLKGDDSNNAEYTAEYMNKVLDFFNKY